MNFDDLDNSLFDAELAASPSELHGMLCGCISGGQSLLPEHIYSLTCQLIDREVAEIEPIADALLALYDHAVGQIRGGGFVFQPILPDDETDIEQRIESLGEWCQGYLFGLGQSGMTNQTKLATEIAEVLRDLAAISQVGLDDGSDDDESSYVELVEYVRVAVLLVAAELDNGEEQLEPTLH